MKAVITGMGIISAVGWTAPQSCAAIRSGLARFSELSALVDGMGEKLIGAPVSPDFFCLDVEPRQAQLIRAVCTEALASFSAAELKARKVTLSVLLSAAFSSKEAQDGITDVILRRLSLLNRVDFALFPYGSGGGASALQEAVERIQEEPDRLELLVGWDSLTARQELVRFDKMHRLKTSLQPRGFLPGEAAACVVIESCSYASQTGRTPYCSIRGTGTSTEQHSINSDKPSSGTGLTNAIRDSMRTACWEPGLVSEVYCDLSGEDYRAYEWGIARLRIDLHSKLTHPADCIGDIGAAFFPVLLCAAGMAFRKHYACGLNAIVFCGSEDGLRGAVCLRSES